MLPSIVFTNFLFARRCALSPPSSTPCPLLHRIAPTLIVLQCETYEELSLLKDVLQREAASLLDTWETRHVRCTHAASAQ